MILKIDNEFRRLIHPLPRNEYLRLEESIMTEGCAEPIMIWNGTIIDGHNRYEICTRHEIPFEVNAMVFECREGAIAWICANQLKKQNLSEETRKYLIGMQYESEKIAFYHRRLQGIHAYSMGAFTDEEVSDELLASRRTALRIAKENHITQPTVLKYAGYARALEELGKKAPQMLPKILSGQYKISHNNVLALSKLSPEEIKRVERRIERSPQPYVRKSKTHNAVNNGRNERMSANNSAGPSVKDMPAFDPDAEITGLTLTIPSWASSIERTRTIADLSIVSDHARNKLTEALLDLKGKAEAMLGALKEDE